jgi:polygalacturonase
MSSFRIDEFPKRQEEKHQPSMCHARAIWQDFARRMTQSKGTIARVHFIFLYSTTTFAVLLGRLFMRHFLFAVCLLLVPFTTLSAKDLTITDRGAIADGETLNTNIIQHTIDDVSAAGGGKVIIPPGVFKTGALFLKQGVELHLDAEAILLGSTHVADYPKQMTRIEGHFEPWLPALINAKDLSGVKITGTGTLNGNGKPFWIAFWKRRAENPKCTNLEVERPRLMFLENCEDVTISGLKFKDSGFWNLHVYKCREVVIDGISITAPHGDPPRITDSEQPWDEISVDRAPSSDGIDIDSCQDVVIRGSTISNGDDCIALKGTKGPMAMQDATSPPVENILIEDCDFLSGHGMLTCGSEATIVRNVTVRNCRVGQAVPIVRLKLRPDTPQLYENLLFENLKALDAQAVFDVKPWTQFFDLQGHGPQPSIVRNVTVRNLTGNVRALGELRGNKGDTLELIKLENINITADNPQLKTDAPEVQCKNVTINGEPWSLH